MCVIHGSRNFCQGGGGGGSRPDSQKTALTTFFGPQFILQFYRGCPMVISKKTIIFPRLKRVEHFPGGPNFFQGGRGVQMLISIETHIPCDFQGGVWTPYLPLDRHLCVCSNSLKPAKFHLTPPWYRGKDGKSQAYSFVVIHYRYPPPPAFRRALKIIVKSPTIPRPERWGYK